MSSCFYPFLEIDYEFSRRNNNPHVLKVDQFHQLRTCHSNKVMHQLATGQTKARHSVASFRIANVEQIDFSKQHQTRKNMFFPTTDNADKTAQAAKKCPRDEKIPAAEKTPGCRVQVQNSPKPKTFQVAATKIRNSALMALKWKSGSNLRSIRMKIKIKLNSKNTNEKLNHKFSQ